MHQRPDRNNPRLVKYFIIAERQFPTFHDLYAHYTFSNISNQEQINNVVLRFPLDRSVWLPVSMRQGHHTSFSQLTISEEEIPPLPIRKKSTPVVFFTKGSNLPEIRSSSVNSEGSENRRSTSSSGSGTGSTTNPGTVDTSTIDTKTQFEMAPVPPPAETFQQPIEHTGGDMYITGGPDDDDDESQSSEEYRPFEEKPIEPWPNEAPPPPPGYKDKKKLEKQLREEQKKEEKRLKENEKRRLKEMEKQERKGKKKDADEKKKKEMRNDLGWCRPPVPTPVQPVTDETPYYSHPRPFCNRLEELKQLLRESEMCDCGLRMMDAELANGWTVHRSREEPTFKRVFYQNENGMTTWVFPDAIAHLLNLQRLEFIIRLCKESNQAPPASVISRCHALKQEQAWRPQSPRNLTHARSQTSLSSYRSRSGSESSQNGSEPFSLSPPSVRNPIDQRPPIPQPTGRVYRV